MTDPAEAAAQRAWDRVDLEIELERHQPVVRMDDGRIGGCQCMDRVFYLGYEDWSTHLADVVDAESLQKVRDFKKQTKAAAKAKAAEESS